MKFIFKALATFLYVMFDIYSRTLKSATHIIPRFLENVIKKAIFYLLIIYVEVIREPFSRGVPVPLFPSKIWPCSLVPQKQNLDFLCSLFPKIARVSLFPLFLGLCFPVPLRKLPLFLCSPKPWAGLIRG